LRHAARSAHSASGWCDCSLMGSGTRNHNAHRTSPTRRASPGPSAKLRGLPGRSAASPSPNLLR
jgi:hypothetical protein